MEELKEAISKSQALEPFKDQLLLDITPGRAAHPDRRRAEPADVRHRQLEAEGLYGGDPAGADAVPELGAEPHQPHRAHRHHAVCWASPATRTGICRRIAPTPRAARWKAPASRTDKVSRVVGLSSSVLFDRANPRNPINRRISIVVLTKEAEQEAQKTDIPTQVAERCDGAPAGEAAIATTSSPNPALPAPSPRSTSR